MISRADVEKLLCEFAEGSFTAQGWNHAIEAVLAIPAAPVSEVTVKHSAHLAALAIECRTAADTLAATRTFQTGQGILRQAADALEAQAAEIARLTAERDRFEEALGRACLVGATAYLLERAEKAEAERDQWAAREGAATNTIVNLNAELLTAHQALSESQALLAMAYEVAAQEADEHRHFAKGIECCGDCIRTLTPADAQAALEARINAAKEEGREAGLREGVECCTTVIDHNLELSIQTGAYRCKEAILANIEEAE